MKIYTVIVATSHSDGLDVCSTLHHVYADTAAEARDKARADALRDCGEGSRMKPHDFTALATFDGHLMESKS